MCNKVRFSRDRAPLRHLAMNLKSANKNLRQMVFKSCPCLLEVVVGGWVGGINRGSYMSIYVLMNLLNELRKSDKMQGLPELNKFHNTGARMLDSIYHMTLLFLKNSIFGVKTSRFSHLFHNV